MELAKENGLDYVCTKFRSEAKLKCMGLSLQKFNGINLVFTKNFPHYTVFIACDIQLSLTIHNIHSVFYAQYLLQTEVEAYSLAYQGQSILVARWCHHSAVLPYWNDQDDIITIDQHRVMVIIMSQYIPLYIFRSDHDMSVAAREWKVPIVCAWRIP